MFRSKYKFVKIHSPIPGPSLTVASSSSRADSQQQSSSAFKWFAFSRATSTPIQRKNRRFLLPSTLTKKIAKFSPIFVPGKPKDIRPSPAQMSRIRILSRYKMRKVTSNRFVGSKPLPAKMQNAPALRRRKANVCFPNVFRLDNRGKKADHYKVIRARQLLNRSRRNSSHWSRKKKISVEKKNRRNFVRPSKFYSSKICIFYQRYGRCSRGAGCPFVHDPKTVRICTRFLKGRCDVKNCPFSHEISSTNVPVCAHFLKDRCHRDECPYLHVKHGKSAEICPDFVQGFCSLGAKCPKKHVQLRFVRRKKRLSKNARGRRKSLIDTVKERAHNANSSKSKFQVQTVGDLPEFIPLCVSSSEDSDGVPTEAVKIYPSFLKLDFDD